MILDIITGKDNSLLRTRSAPVEKITPVVQKLIRNMHETLANTKNGVGLAAPQVSTNIRLFVVAREVAQDEHLVFINPRIVHLSRNTQNMEEGCLSLPGQWDVLGRPKKVTIIAQDEHGKEFTYHATGLCARIMVHEIDHLNGTLFIDHLKAKS